MNNNAYVRWVKNCVWQTFGETLLILNASKQDPTLFSGDEYPGVMLNETAKDIWELCDGTRTLEDICGELLELYGGDTAVICDSAADTISALKDAALIEFLETPDKYDQIELPPQKYAVPSSAVQLQGKDNRVSAHDNKTDTTFEFSTEISTLWKLCDGSRSIRQILDKLSELDLINEDQPAGRMKLVIKQLIHYGLLELSDVSV